MIEAKVSKFHLISLLFIALGYIATTIASYVFEFNQILLGWFNPASFLILIIYAISIWKTPKVEEDDDEEEDSSTLSIKQIIVRFILFAVILIAASIGITYCADWVCNEFNMAASFGGALFLGVATSLPELTSTINLCRKKNFDAAFGNLFGSCVFNFFILSIADLLSFRSIDNAHKLYYLDQSSFICLLAGAFIVLLAFISILILIKKGAKDKVGYRIFFYAVSILSVGLYIAFLVLSNIQMDIPFIV